MAGRRRIPADATAAWSRVAEAFARSLNAATVVLAQHVGMENVAAAAKELGIDAPLDPVPALALGASEVSLLDLTGAYASVRWGTAPVEPWGVIDFQAATEPQAFRVGPQVTPSVDLSAYRDDLSTLLQLVVERGTGREASPGFFAAGKTGTSQNNRDAWFVGFTETLVAGVWVGNDDDTPMKGVTGGALPARIWREFMQAAMAEPVNARWPRDRDIDERTATRCFLQYPRLLAKLSLFPSFGLYVPALSRRATALRKITVRRPLFLLRRRHP